MTDTAIKPAPQKAAALAVPPAASPIEAVPPKATATPAAKAPVTKAVAAPVPPANPPKPVLKRQVRRIKAVTKPTKATAAKPALTVAKDVKMTDTFKTITDKTQTLFAEANARTREAVEKSTKTIEEVTAFNKGNVEALVESSRIAVKGMEKLGQDAASYAKTSYEKATEALKSMTSVKSPTELFKLQSEFARASFEAFVAETSRSTESALKLAGEVAQPLSSRFALAAEKIKVVA